MHASRVRGLPLQPRILRLTMTLLRLIRASLAAPHAPPLPLPTARTPLSP